MNEVKIKVDDRTKTLRFMEALTSGSRYRVVVDGGAAVCGAAGSLVLMDRGELVAFAELTDGEGMLSTNTREMAEALKRMPVGASLDFDTILHKKGDAEGENVAVGICRVVAAGGAWTDDTTGALTLYKGEKGDVGATGADGKDGKDGTDGKDGADGRDGKDGTDGKSAFELAVAEGFEGTEAEWLKSLVGLPGALSEVQLIDAEGNRTSEFYEVLCKEVDGEKVLVLEQTKVEGIAAKSNAERAEMAATAAAASEKNAADSAAASKTSAESAADSAAASEKNAADGAAASQTSAANAAANAANAAVSAANAAASEKNAADSAAASQTSAANAAESEKNAAESAAASQTSAESAAESAAMAMESMTGRFCDIRNVSTGAYSTENSITVESPDPCGDCEGESFRVVALFYSGSASQKNTLTYNAEVQTDTGFVGLRSFVFSPTCDEDSKFVFTFKRSANSAPTCLSLLIFRG